MNPYLNEISEKITQWFHTSNSDDISPAKSVHAVATKFMNDVEQKRFELADTRQKFYNLLCEATCALYRAASRNNNKRVIFSRRVRNPPPGWTNAIETLWMDYLETMVFSETYWTAFWRQMDDAQWENAVPEWRSYIQFVLLNCIQRDMYLLEDEGLIAKTEDGDFVKTEEYDPPAYDDE
jgi:hypothetical protein